MFFHDLYRSALDQTPEAIALIMGEHAVTYAALDQQVQAAAAGLQARGLTTGSRVCVYAAQSVEMVVAMLAISRAGGVVVPINPVLKEKQFSYIVADCGAQMVVVDAGRFRATGAVDSVNETIVIGEVQAEAKALTWAELLEPGGQPQSVTDVQTSDLAALLYTSGSTGRPKGVMLSHVNLTMGAESVSDYLEISADDRLLCVLPLSFDYGLSQLTCALYAGGCAVLINYLFPADVIKALARYEITGLACVPPLWQQLLASDWPEDARKTLRYVTNSGGQLPQTAASDLRSRLPDAKLYLMYGLTEAFRSTFLDPAITDAAPNAIGQAIPNAVIDVINSDGEPCTALEHGELVHSGPLVAQGYWNDPERTAERFKPSPSMEGMAVWSGDVVYRGEDGLLYFVGREDGLIKTSGYRVSPTEIEEVLIAHPAVTEVAVIGVPHAALGQEIVAVYAAEDALDADSLMKYCRADLPAFMVPGHYARREKLAKNANGKIDRNALQAEFADLYVDEDS